MDMSTRSDLALGAEQKTAATRGLAQVTRVTPLRVRRGHPHQITLSTTRLGGPSPPWWTPENRLEIINGWVPALQTSDQVAGGLHWRGFPIASPAALGRNSQAFRAAVRRYADGNQIAWVVFRKGDRKLEVVRPYLDAAERAGRSEVVAIGEAREFQWVFDATKKAGPDGVPWFRFYRTERLVTCYYF